IRFLGSEEKEKLLGELEKKVRFPGRLLIYPDITVAVVDHSSLNKLDHFSFDPLREEYFPSDGPNYQHFTPVNLEEKLDLNSLKLSQKLGKKVDLYDYLGEGQIYVRYGERIPPKLDPRVQFQVPPLGIELKEPIQY